MMVSSWMARSLFKNSLFRTGLAAFLLFGSTASGLHQLVNDGDFEILKPKDTWEETTSGPYSKVDSHFPVGTDRAGAGNLYGTQVYIDALSSLSTCYDHDVYVHSIEIPDSVEVGKSYTPRAGCVGNAGTFIESFDVVCDIDYSDNNVYSDTARVDSLLPGSAIYMLPFKEWTPEDVGLYLVKVQTLLENDENPENDTVSKQVNAYTGIEEQISSRPLEFRVWPNPARDVVRIEGKSAEVYDVSGRLIASVEGDRWVPGGSGVFFIRSGLQVQKVVVLR